LSHQNNLAAKLLACNTAREYSHFAENHDLEVTALIQQAVTFDSQKQHEQSFGVYQQALPHLDRVSPLLGTRVLAGLGGSYARCGQQEYEAQQYLDWARNMMPDHPEADPTFLYADCGPFTLPLWEGRTSFELDQLERAFQIFSQEKGHRNIPERIRTEFLNHLLETSIAQGDLDQSILCLQEAKQAAINLKSERRQREVQEAYQTMLHIWRHDRKRIQNAIEVSTN
jgi:tetratricopeptide (TPR) repeat protein